MKKLNDLGLTPEEEKEILQELKEKHEPVKTPEEKEFQHYLNQKFPES